MGYLNKTCAKCGAPFTVHETMDRVRCCSKECGYALRRFENEEVRQCAKCGAEFRKTRSKPQKYCSFDCAKRGAGALRQRGWREQTPGGYIIRCVGSKTIMQHREVMEQHLGRPLKAYENVHHKNGDRQDNRLENLEVWVMRPRPGQRIPDMIEWAEAFLRSHGYVVTKA